jgi:hypothetical protein
MSGNRSPWPRSQASRRSGSSRGFHRSWPALRRIGMGPFLAIASSRDRSTRARDGARVAHPCARIPAGAWCRIRLHRQSGQADCRRHRLFPRPTLLPSPSTPLCRGRAEGRCLQARACRQDELLSLVGGRSAQTQGRPTQHRSLALSVEKPRTGRVRPTSSSNCRGACEEVCRPSRKSKPSWRRKGGSESSAAGRLAIGCVFSKSVRSWERDPAGLVSHAHGIRTGQRS